jgi:proteasome lid subunit RPN8/RPN11
MLRIEQEIIDKIVEHGRAEAPLEACGYLAAKDDVVNKCIAMKNVDASPVHYSMAPAEQFAAARAVYHTHPETAAYPSAEDIKLAYDPSISYVIVSLAESNPNIHSFIIKKDKVIPEQIEIIGEKK